MKKNIALIAGGNSGEYSISVNSAAAVAQHIDPNLFNVYRIHIKGMEWTCVQGDEVVPVNKDDFSINLDGTNIRFDCVFNAIHGSPGEDGKLSGYFEMLGIPVTSGDTTNLAITFNKHYCKRVLAAEGIAMAHSRILFRGQECDFDALSTEFSFPVFVKPNNGGSSVGMSKVIQPSALEEAVQRAFVEDSQVLVEEFVSGKEFSCGLYQHNSEVVPLPITEIISKNEFFDYQAKYNDELHQEITPAVVSDKLTVECQQLSQKIYQLLNCRGVVRVDYIFDGAVLHFLEINTVPGMSSMSIVPQQARAAGFTDKEFYTIILQEAMRCS